MEIKGNWFWVGFFCTEWKQIGQACNYYTFTPLWLTFEYDRMTGCFQATFTLLGFEIRSSWSIRRPNQRFLDALKNLLRDVK